MAIRCNNHLRVKSRRLKSPQFSGSTNFVLRNWPGIRSPNLDSVLDGKRRKKVYFRSRISLKLGELCYFSDVIFHVIFLKVIGSLAGSSKILAIHAIEKNTIIVTM